MALGIRRLHGGIVVGFHPEASGVIGLEQSFLIVIVQIRNGKHHFLNLHILHIGQRGAGFRQYRNIVDIPTNLLPVHIHKAHRNIDRRSVVQQILRQTHTHPACTNDGNAGAVGMHRPLPRHLTARENPKQEQQEPAEPGGIAAAFIGVAVNHPNGQRSQQIGAGNGQQSRKGNVHRQEEPFRKIADHKAAGIRHQQTHVALDAAVAPDLAVDLSHKPCREHGAEGDQNLVKCPHSRKALAGENQQKHIHQKQYHHIIKKEGPLDICMSLQNAHPHRKRRPGKRQNSTHNPIYYIRLSEKNQSPI